VKLDGIASNGLQDVARRRSGNPDLTREECDGALVNTASYEVWAALCKGTQNKSGGMIITPAVTFGQLLGQRIFKFA
jgi:hypothetical protein